MKIRTLLGSILIAFSIIIGIYSYWQLTSREREMEINLFSLVPQNTVAILETNSVSELLKSIDNSDFAQEYDSLNVSDILKFLKQNIDLLAANSAHGISPQMNQMLISFHGTTNPRDQILYGKLTSQDKALMENIIKRNCSTVYSAKSFNYKGEEINIYPLNDEDFIACYFKSGFYVISYQKKLIEEVIDAYLCKKSVLNDNIFACFCTEKKNYSSPASLYIKSQNIPLGENTEEKGYTLHLSRWTAFNINMKDDAIYLSGNCLDTDTCLSFQNMLKSQKPIELFSGKYLPESTTFFYQMATSDFKKIITFTTKKKYPPVHCTSPLQKNDSLFCNYLIENGGDELQFFMFCDDKELRKTMRIKMNDIAEADIKMNNLLAYAKKETKHNPKQRRLIIKGKEFKIFRLPRNTIFAQFSSNPAYMSDTYGCFYDGSLVVTPTDSCIYSYIEQIESGKTVEYNSIYGRFISNLSSSMNYTLLADMEDATLHPKLYERLLPQFFFRHQDFFKRFILSIQFTCVDQKTYPYLVLMHKNKRNQQDISNPSNAK